MPLLPTFARLWGQTIVRLVARIRQGLMLSTASMLPLGACCGLGAPIVSLVYARGAFDQRAVQRSLDS